jgi:hypothetical protein
MCQRGFPRTVDLHANHQKLQIIASGTTKTFNEEQIAAIASGFVNNTTLRDLEFQCWQEADLERVLIALQCHPTKRYN